MKSMTTDSKDTTTGPESDDTDLVPPLAWEGRVLAVALVWSIPGVLLGILLALALSPFLSELTPVVVTSGVAGAVMGGLLEADYWA